jgi:hypothetical protein
MGVDDNAHCSITRGSAALWGEHPGSDALDSSQLDRSVFRNRRVVDSAAPVCGYDDRL